MTNLTSLPNIGPVVAENLKRVGIETPDQLMAVGAQEAWLRIRLLGDEGACLHQLEALEGAVLGIPKKELPAERRAELKTFFKKY